MISCSVWRYVFESEDRIASYYTHDNVVATLSSPGGTILLTFDLHTGLQLLEKRLHPPELGHLAEPHFFWKTWNVVLTFIWRRISTRCSCWRNREDDC
ncbi:hypothetical protein AN958_04241 [Leucoagaricus sp. SymC.cos]|nr:hypothetical protein AN958_04241 [Leucoagaricus sp. SymC.cos]